MDRNFSRAINAVLEYEGGYVNNPQDKGGPTNLGVTLANFRAYVKPDGTIDDLKKLTREQAGVVFRRHYWDEVMGSSLPDGIDLCVFDYAVNSGPSRAVKLLQTLAGTAADGKIGSKTLAAVEAIEPGMLIDELCDGRLKFLKGIPSFPTFGKGWVSRVEKVRALAHTMVAQPDNTKVVVKETEVPVEVPVVPHGSDKRKFYLPAGLTGLGSILLSTFGGLDWQGKLIFALIAIGAIIVSLFLGEMIVRRAKHLRDVIEEG
jgi:lysozyme family protein